MIFAETMGKFSERGERSEDMLTSTAFGLLRYIPIEQGFLPLLRRARRVWLENETLRAERENEWIELKNICRIDVIFWPAFEDGIPDIVLECFDGDETLRAAVLIEVKLHSTKSGWATNADEPLSEEDDDRLPAPSDDQLDKYWRGLRAHYPGLAKTALSLMYLTAHGIPPELELRTSLECDPTMRLGWLSWEDVFAVTNGGASLPARDLARLLGHKGFSPFNGFARLPAMNLRSFLRG